MLSNPFKSKTIANFICKSDTKTLGAGFEIGFFQVGNGRLGGWFVKY